MLALRSPVDFFPPRVSHYGRCFLSIVLHGRETVHHSDRELSGTAIVHLF
jgi:hypothetical protein